MPEILDRLQPIFCDVFDDQGLTITRQSNASNVEGWDSLAHINLIASIEQELHVRFALGELQDLKDVGDMVDLIERKLRK